MMEFAPGSAGFQLSVSTLATKKEHVSIPRVQTSGRRGAGEGEGRTGG